MLCYTVSVIDFCALPLWDTDLVSVRRAKDGDHEAITSILLMYRPLLLKYAVINGRLDEDLYQELCITLMRAIDLFRI